jgi:DNA-binding winged helix-turn-helix (wHTH) protein
MDPTTSGVLRFGDFELDLDREELRRDGRRVKLQPQPFKVLTLLVTHAGRQVTREEIRRHVWPDGTFVDYEQGVNFCIKQVREALRDVAERPVYIETVPRRGYRFLAPVTSRQEVATHAKAPADGTTMRLQKILWTNIAELRMAEERRRRHKIIGLTVVIVVLAAAGLVLFFR